jgi:hypothetical protein
MAGPSSRGRDRRGEMRESAANPQVNRGFYETGERHTSAGDVRTEFSPLIQGRLRGTSAEPGHGGAPGGLLFELEPSRCDQPEPEREPAQHADGWQRRGQPPIQLHQPVHPLHRPAGGKTKR